MTLITTKEVLGTEVEIHVDKFGSFRVMEDDRALGHGDTLDAAIAKARVELNKRKVKVEVPFLTRAGENGVATGFHARNRTVLTRVDGESHAFEPMSARRMFPPDMPKAKLQRYLTLREQESTIKREINEIEREFEYDVYGAVTRAIDAAIEAKGKPLARKR